MLSFTGECECMSSSCPSGFITIWLSMLASSQPVEWWRRIRHPFSGDCLENILAQWQYMVSYILVNICSNIPCRLETLADILETFLKSLSCMKIFVFWIKFHWSVFTELQLTISQHYGLTLNKWPAIIWTNASQAYRGIRASLSLHKLRTTNEMERKIYARELVPGDTSILVPVSECWIHIMWKLTQEPLATNSTIEMNYKCFAHLI